MVGIAFDSTQSVFLYYTNRLYFISLEKNALAIYLLQAGYWYGLVIWEASLGFLAVLMARTRKILVRYFALIISSWMLIGPLSWWSAIVALTVFYTVAVTFLVTIMSKGYKQANALGKPCLSKDLLSFSV